MKDDIIFHLVSKEEWKRQQQSGLYRPESLETEGYIACSAGHQVQQVANSRFRGEEGLLLLVVDRASLESDVRFELAGTGEGEGKYPHIYGPLNIDAVIDKIQLDPEEDGTFFIEFNTSE